MSHCFKMNYKPSTRRSTIDDRNIIKEVLRIRSRDKAEREREGERERKRETNAATSQAGSDIVAVDLSTLPLQGRVG